MVTVFHGSPGSRKGSNAIRKPANLRVWKGAATAIRSEKGECRVAEVAEAFLNISSNRKAVMQLESESMSRPRVGLHAGLEVRAQESVCGWRRIEKCLEDCLGVLIWPAAGLLNHITGWYVSIWGC